MPNLSDSFADSFTTHSVDLLRVSESLREKLLQDLEYLELDLIADLQEVTGENRLHSRETPRAPDSDPGDYRDCLRFHRE